MSFTPIICQNDACTSMIKQISRVLKSNLWRVLGYLEPLCSAASTTTQFDAETLDAVSAAYCTTHHLTSMESL